MEKIKLLFLLLCSLFVSCDTTDGFNDVVFIGDVYVERWSLGECFPDINPKNCGLSNTGIDHLKHYKDMFNRLDIVVMTGSKDFYRSMDDSYIDSCVESYVSNLLAIGKDNHYYVFSIQPVNDNLHNVTVSINNNIKKFNSKLDERCKNLGWTFIDAYDYFLADDGTLRKDLTIDNNHYTKEAYMFLASLLKTKLNK